MWIIPSTISPSAPATAESTLDCDQFSRLAEQSLLWRSKPSLSKTWSRRWKRETWIRHLSGRICTPSHSQSFEDWWTSSLEASRANHSATPVHDWELKTRATFGPQSPEESESADQLLFSSRTWTELQVQSRPATPQFSTMSLATWKAWVTERRQDSSQRRKSVVRTSENGGSSWGWPTPTTQMESPRAKYAGGAANDGKNLIDVVVWPTASARDWKDTPGMSTTRSDRSGEARAADQLPRAVFKHDGLRGQATNSTNGNRGVHLNPDWVETLMGLPRGWTDFDCSATG